ncbi:MAG: VWA domain-containing protein [Myxococcales bacterium]|nr:VWA domain-containing protein [Myxococcales bacterium]
MTFAHPAFFWLLAALPVVWGVRRLRRPPTVRFGAVDTAAQAAGGWPALTWLVGALRYGVYAALIVALARPQQVDATEEVEASGVDLMLAVDVSESMQALDMQHDGARESRLEAVKRVIADFVEARPNDRIGVIAFAGAPYLVSPLTLDHGWLLQNLERLETGRVEDGTAVGDALAAAVDRLRDVESASKLVVLLTDGENNAGAISPGMAAEAARTLGIKVHAIGVGSEGEAPVPITDENGDTRVVMARVGVGTEMVEKIAETTGGEAFRATDADALAQVYHRIDAMETTTRTVKRFEHAEERFHLAAVFGFGLLLTQLGLAVTALRRVP